MNKSHKPGLLAGVLFSALLLACSGSSEVDLIASAKTLLAKHDNKAAIIQLKSALQKNAKSGEARYLLGQALIEEGNLASALSELKRAQDLGYEPDLVAPKMARAMLATGQFKSIVDTYSQTKIGTPLGQAELHTALSIAQAGLGNVEKMQTELNTALAALPKYAWALQTKARIAVSKEDYDAALALVNESLEGDPASGEAWLLKGSILFSGKKDPVAALAAFDKAIQDQRSALSGRMSVIAMHLMTSKPNEARQQIELMQKEYPNSAAVVYAKAQLAYQEKDYAKAKEQLQPLLNAFPNSPKLLLFAGSADKMRGAYSLAETELSKALNLAPGLNDARKVLAETYLAMGQAHRAQAVLRPMMEGQQKADGAVLALAASAYLQEGNVLQAEALFTQAAKLRPDDVVIRTALALTDMARGNADSAFVALQGIAASDPGSTADMALIAAQMRRGNIEAALQAIDRLQKKEPTKPTPSFLRGRAELQRRNESAARAAFEATLKLEPLYFGATAALAGMDVADGKLDAARQRLEGAAKLTPNNSAAHMALVQVMARQGAKPDEIAGVLNEAIKANALDPAPRLGLLALLVDTRDFKAAQSAAQSALAAFPDNPEVLYAAGNAQGKAGADQQAISIFSKLASLQPASPLPHLRLAEVYARRNDEAAAALSRRRAFDVAPESPEVQRSLIVAMMKSKDAAYPLTAARELQKRMPQRASGYLFEGDIYTLQKNWRAAEAAFRQALGKADPDNRATIGVYQTLISAGQVPDAERFAETWLKSNPGDAVFMNRLGEVAMSRNDFAGAERRFTAAIAASPKNVSALNNMAWLLAKRGSKNSLEYALKAAALAPNEAPVLDTLAQAYAANQQFSEAVAAERKARQLVPDNPYYKLNLAKLLVQAGDPSAAKVELEALATLGAKFNKQSEVADLRRKIQP